ncbi:hypothetical protein M2448_003864 [Dysgonomonas sp. PF1-14]|uniref:hypothetical protein n=1 Tax=Dysgonomonas sp. PF1-14 TaxID=2940630 RepID=UPI0024732B2D|nr:hypothetical protein [Dysgonomonas sp. PF1-14]MDH6310912.1 hypothetical protein [Dysgonomonas sp. PF1-14]
MEKDIYKENGYKDRNDYLKSLSEDYSTDRHIVNSMAEVLSENEDFDGLICALEDFPML